MEKKAINRKIHFVLDKLEKMASYYELESFDVLYDKTYYFIPIECIDYITQLNKFYNVRIKVCN